MSNLKLKSEYKEYTFGDASGSFVLGTAPKPVLDRVHQLQPEFFELVEPVEQAKENVLKPSNK